MIIGLLISFLPILMVVAIFIIGISWYIAKTSLVPTRTPKTKSPRDYGMHFEDFSVRSHGLTLKGWFIPAPDESFSEKQKTPTIILTHGWGRSAEQMLPHAEYLHHAGFHLILFDVRGHGDSDSVEYVTMNRIVEDLDAVIYYTLKRPEVNSEAIGLFGHSMGAAASILKASQNSQVKAVASSSGFADLADLTVQMLRWRKLPAFPFRFLIQKFWENGLGCHFLRLIP